MDFEFLVFAKSHNIVHKIYWLKCKKGGSFRTPVHAYLINN